MPAEIIQAAVALIPALVSAIAAAVEANDVEALEALARVCPTADVIALRDEALVRSQRAKAEAELAAGSQ